MVTSLPGMLVFSIRDAGWSSTHSTSLFQLLANTCSGTEQVMTQILECLSLTLETCMEFLAPVCSLAQSDHCRHLRSKLVDGRISLHQPVSVSLPFKMGAELEQVFDLALKNTGWDAHVL